MMGKPKSLEPKLYYDQFSLCERIPPEHPLRRIKQLVDFGFVRRLVKDRYGYNGNPSLDPALVLKLMFLMFCENVRSERELMRTLGYRLDWLWFCNMDLDESIPDHSVLSKARRRWGLGVFEEVFSRVLGLCLEAGLVEGRTSYVDSTLLKADASLSSRISRKLWEQLEAGMVEEEGEAGPPPQPGQEGGGGGGEGGVRTPAPVEDTQADELPAGPRGKHNAARVSQTDPDAATTFRRGRGVLLGYRDHSMVDGKCGVVTATVATAADYDDGAMLETLVDKQEEYTGLQPERLVGDGEYGTKANREGMRERGIRPYLKHRASKGDDRHWLERMGEECDAAVAKELMRRRLHTAEGRFAEAHVRYDHRRCRWRRRWRVQIQCYLVATVQNVGKLLRWALGRRRPARSAALLSPLFSCFACLSRLFRRSEGPALAFCGSRRP